MYGRDDIDNNLINIKTGLPKRPAIRNASGLPMGRIPSPSTQYSSHYTPEWNQRIGPPVVATHPAVPVNTEAPTNDYNMGKSDNQNTAVDRGNYSWQYGNGKGFRMQSGFAGGPLDAWSRPTGAEDNLRREASFLADESQQRQHEDQRLKAINVANMANEAQTISAKEAAGLATLAMMKKIYPQAPGSIGTPTAKIQDYNALVDYYREKGSRDRLSGNAGIEAVNKMNQGNMTNAQAEQQRVQAEMNRSALPYIGPKAEAEIALHKGQGQYYGGRNEVELGSSRAKAMADALAARQRQSGKGALDLKSRIDLENMAMTNPEGYARLMKEFGIAG